MQKTILITGATDGIGFETAKLLTQQGHHLLIHGRNEAKLATTESALKKAPGAGTIETYRSDLSALDDIQTLANTITSEHKKIDVLINNAGVFKVSSAETKHGIDMRFVVNTLAPYLLTKQLLPLIPADGRVVNLSSAAQAEVNLDALRGKVSLDERQAYAQSKLAITMWSFHLADILADNGPAIIAVNPASLLGSKMVKEAFGIAGNDLSVGADILVRAALSEEFADANGRYYDNDNHCFADPHADALDSAKNERLVAIIEELLAPLIQ